MNKVTIKYTHFNDPVFKDSCVEFFFNPFPEHREEYFNIEFNAIGVIWELKVLDNTAKPQELFNSEKDYYWTDCFNKAIK